MPRKPRKSKLPGMEYLERLEKALDARGITWKEVARHLQVWPNKISKWKSGEGYPKFDQIVMICKLADIPIDWLTGTDPSVPPPRSPEELALLDLVTRGPEAIGFPNAIRAVMDYIIAHPEIKGTAHLQQKTAALASLPTIGEARKRGRGKKNPPKG